MLSIIVAVVSLLISFGTLIYTIRQDARNKKAAKLVEFQLAEMKKNNERTEHPQFKVWFEKYERNQRLVIQNTGEVEVSNLDIEQLSENTAVHKDERDFPHAVLKPSEKIWLFSSRELDKPTKAETIRLTWDGGSEVFYPAYD